MPNSRSNTEHDQIFAVTSSQRNLITTVILAAVTAASVTLGILRAAIPSSKLFPLFLIAICAGLFVFFSLAAVTHAINLAVNGKLKTED